MKTKSILMSVLLCLALAGCNKEVESVEEDSSGKAYLALALINQAQPTSRANTNEDGTTAENYASSVTVLCFNESAVCVDVQDFTNETTTNGVPNSIVASSRPVDKSTKQIFVVVNNNTKLGTLASDLKGKTWSEINTVKGIDAADISTDNKFVMVNEGGIGLNGLTAITLQSTEALAKANPATINVDRLAAKVTVTQPTGFTVSPTTAGFEFQGWELNTMSKMGQYYTEIIDIPGGTTTARKANYHIDSNYKDLTETAQNTVKYLTDNYTWLSNGTSATDLSKVERAKDAAAYAPENTMAAASQLWGHSTKVVVRAKYHPTDKTNYPSYFTWNGTVYDLATLKTTYLTNSGLKADVVKFLNKLGTVTETDPTKVLQAEIDTALGNLDEYSGIAARYLALRYYHESVCYYDVIVRHDQSIAGLMALGRYGVVRNNSYTLELLSVSGPGTPWIPNPSEPDPTDPTKPDPENPTKPTDPDDQAVNLAVKIVVNPWIGWKQGVDLH